MSSLNVKIRILILSPLFFILACQQQKKIYYTADDVRKIVEERKGWFNEVAGHCDLSKLTGQCIEYTTRETKKKLNRHIKSCQMSFKIENKFLHATWVTHKKCPKENRLPGYCLGVMKTPFRQYYYKPSITDQKISFDICVHSGGVFIKEETQ